MKIAVVGASGFLGSNLIRQLSRNRIETIALTRNKSKPPLVPSCTYIYTDYSDSRSLLNSLHGVDVVVHLAGLAHQKLPKSDASSILKKVNVECLKSICYASSALGVNKLIYISSIGVLGNSTNGVAFDDCASPNPSNSYSKSKLEAEIFLRDFSFKSSLNHIIIRPPLVYGNHCPGNLAKLIKFIKLSPIVPFATLNNLRSFISIDNLVDAIVSCAMSSNSSGGSYVISDCHDVPFNSIVASLVEGLNKSPSSLVSCNPSLLRVFSSLIGKRHVFDQLSSELIVDASGFCTDFNWLPKGHPLDMLKAASASFV